MKKIKYINLVVIVAALVLEILPLGAKIVWGGFFYQPESYHSYFSTEVWHHSSNAFFVCGVFTAISALLIIVTMFKRVHKFYRFVLCAVLLSAVISSVVPAISGVYSIVAFIVTILLSASTELSIIEYSSKTKR